MQIPVALDETNVGKIFWMCASANMAIYAIGMTKLEVNHNVVALHPGNSQFLGKNDLIMKYEVESSYMTSPSFIVFHYYLDVDVDVTHILQQMCHSMQ